jgi:meso-butanediol dehydrogenase/(S,S)-butanediol dehydrogenase/diacetyl reductase
VTARRVLVTGALGGIGGAVLEELSQLGMTVVGLDVIEQAEPRVLACDVSDAGFVHEAVGQAVELLGGLDGVVNVVGVSGRRLGDGPVDVCSDEAWEHVMATNVRSVFLVCRAAIPALGRGSSIVNVTSVLGMQGDASGFFDTHAYAASKGAVIALTKAMAGTYAPRGIRVNAVAPGLVVTPMSQRAQSDRDVTAYVEKRQPLTGMSLTANHVAAAVGYLCSLSSAAVTGVILPVDGGWTAT